MVHRFSPVLIALSCGALALTGTATTAAHATGDRTARPRAAAPAAASPGDIARAAYARMTAAQRVGQLFMIGVPAGGPRASQVHQLEAASVGNVFLRGRSSLGVSTTHAIVARLGPELTHQKAKPFVGTDQEGGEVQVLSGPGFSTMPTGLDQGRLGLATLRADAQTWGAQLHAAGVNVNLAPVADTVPASVGTANQPIGQYYREFGYTPTTVRGHVTSFVNGMHAGKVATAVKHFPGLGRATGNTDTTVGVTDPTGPRDDYLLPFHDGITAGSEFVMVSSARYPNIDPSHSACFSLTVITGLLRGHEKFTGIVISDSFAAAAVSGLSPGQRALHYFAAGGTMLLDTNSDDVGPMASAVLTHARQSAKFAYLIKRAVLKVLYVKAKRGLLT